MKKIVIINGSASSKSSNQILIDYIIAKLGTEFEFFVYNDLKIFPHFDPELSLNNTPQSILELRDNLSNAHGVFISTPEYIFSIPSGLKNLIEWCISSTVFADKPCAIITASADGRKGHEELKLIMKTAMATVTDETTLLIQGIKGKFDSSNNLNDEKLIGELELFIVSFKNLMNNKLN
jgi:NAD(P)H-dependent FMN reductase